MSDLEAAVLALARSLPTGQRERLAAVLGSGDGPTASTRSAALRVSPGAGYTEMVAALLRCWQDDLSVSPAGLALALDTAGTVCDQDRARTVRPVWTGPDAGNPVRLTASVVAEVISGARERLLLLSFTSYKVPQVMDALGVAAAGGVDVDIVLDRAIDNPDHLRFDEASRFAALDGVRVWHWPTDQRPPEGGTLHAKAVVADGRVALVTSANLTGRALSDNIELGLLVHDAATAGEITAHVTGLMREGILARVEP